MRRALPIAVIACLLAPAGAEAHSLVRSGGGLVSYTSADATSLNTLVVRQGGGRVEFRDDTVDGGMDPGSCTPGAVDRNGFITQTFCSLDGISRVRIDLADREDSARIALDLPVTLVGGTGADDVTGGSRADEISGGDGNDRVAGGAGDDVLAGDAGADTIEGGEGDDRIAARDGEIDRIACGPGADSVDADGGDVVAADCESAARSGAVPPPTVVDDGRPPQVDAGAPTLQRVGRSRVVRVYATSSEIGTLAASGFLEAGDLRLPVERIGPERVAVPGAGAQLDFRLKGRNWRATRAALRKKRKVTVRLGVVATDRSGKSASRNAPVIRLKRGAAAAPATARAAHPEPNDVDGDEVRNEVDNCPDVRNGSQTNTDRDTEPDPGVLGQSVLGDACDDDDDADGVPDFDGNGQRLDNCRVDANPDQADTDGDGYGDVCPPVDTDSDGVIDDDDNCDTVENENQRDLDGDDKGDACDRDVDGDRFDDEHDNCPTVYNLEPNDVDGNGWLDDQLDGDGDGVGTACDPDESVVTPPPPAPPAPVVEPDRTRPGLGVRVARRYRMGEHKAGIVVRLTCSEACSATARLARGKRRLGSGTARLGGRGTTYAFVRFGRSARRAVRRGRPLRAKLTVTVADPSGNRRTSTRRVALSR